MTVTSIGVMAATPAAAKARAADISCSPCNWLRQPCSLRPGSRISSSIVASAAWSRRLINGKQCGGSSRSCCRGFVGEGTRPAGQYHSADFEWEELVEEGQAAVARQWEELRQHLEEQQLRLQQQQEGCELESRDSEKFGSAGNSIDYKSDDSWERFHSQHDQARFFKEKRYLILEFPSLAVVDPPQHIAEIGCGCGSALLPVLAANPMCRVTACDISPTALQLFRRAAEQAGVAQDRIHTFVLDASSSNGGAGAGVLPSADRSTTISMDGSSSSAQGRAGRSPLAGLDADSLLLVFTLSALPPEAHAAALVHAYDALKPGGLLLFRDYGKYDMAQLRFPGAQMLRDNLYRRKEGTLAYFFSTEALREAATAAGFEEAECEYARVQLRNRKNGTAMRRVFVHAVFRKPLTD